MDEKTYDPSFAVKVEKNHEGECQFVRWSHFFDGCTVKGCRVSRISRDWIAMMQRAAHNTREGQ